MDANDERMKKKKNQLIETVTVHLETEGTNIHYSLISDMNCKRS